MEQLTKYGDLEIIGLTEKDARAAIKRLDLKCRVMEVDGVRMIGTMEMRHDRVNLSIENDLVTKYWWG